MPQMTKGGKFIFGKSRIRDDLTVRIPPQAIAEYDAASEGRVYLFTGSKSTGGFCVTRRSLLESSKLGHILTENPALRDGLIPAGEFVRYKGRAYCWTPGSREGILQFIPEMLDFLDLRIGTMLLCIRSSDIAFTMGARGPLVERSLAYQGEIEIY